MQTPLESLIKKIEAAIQDAIETKNYIAQIELIKTWCWAKDYLKKEKDHLIDANRDGVHMVLYKDMRTADEWYFKKYKRNKLSTP
ncbi:hypothetical protein UFOVP579_36 [uncultured Caudovirales phage]|uniref:Uncharacterized protein n=1 Tax=uncultured Caudovirales phage TaxID=2100421 RepID=A0A6J5LPW8_9CAUD|nr:hypothetical protein UFOVP302_36 [uncultured Caudovirales phage]CAB4168725.1 hypothetical protein UFOVP579_36 [uncultured Caudovirales phage]